MNATIYNASILCGVLLAGIGIGIMLGIGAGLAATGGLVIGLTLHGASMLRRMTRGE